MPYEIKFDMPPAGYSISAAKKNEKATVATIEFTSSEDGDLFISRLEGFPSEIISKLSCQTNIRESQIDNLLAIIRPDNTATVYVNELNFIIKSRVTRSVKKGEPVLVDDIIDIDELKIVDVEIPEDAGFAFVFSNRWRKAFFYDFKPLVTSKEKRAYDISKILGNCYGYLSFQNLFKITDEEWKCFFEQQWFPFISLKKHVIDKMLDYIRAGWNIDDILINIATDTKKSLDSMLKRWENHDLFLEHFRLFERSVERYKSEDYISCTSILYPRIEGIIRAIHQKNENSKKATQKNLVKSLGKVRIEDQNRYSRLLPQKFVEYIEQVYFANFIPGSTSTISRNTIGHGVAPVKDFSLKAATIGLLIIDQIYYHLPPESKHSI